MAVHTKKENFHDNNLRTVAEEQEWREQCKVDVACSSCVGPPVTDVKNEIINYRMNRSTPEYQGVLFNTGGWIRNMALNILYM